MSNNFNFFYKIEKFYLVFKKRLIIHPPKEKNDLKQKL
jgi:hypothetical protein